MFILYCTINHSIFISLYTLDIVMSKALPIAVAVLLGGVALAPVMYAIKHPANPNATQVAKLGENASNIEIISYALGFALAQQVPPEADNNALIAGYNDARNDKESRYTNEEIQMAFDAYQKEMMDKQNGEHKGIANAPASSDEAKAFFAENAKKEGVKTTASGLQYKIITEGSGKSPNPDSKVTVHYEGKLLNGNVFDSSLKRGEPITFPLNGVIKGWQEGVALMKEGGKAELYIPAELAYGKEEMPGIPANSPLIFQVELIKVE